MDTEVKEPCDGGLSGRDLPDDPDDKATGPDVRASRCEWCSAPARVHILEDYVNGQPVHRHFCLECADAAYGRHLEGGTGQTRPRPRLSSLLIATGLLLAILGASADLLFAKGGVGFGWKQQTGLAVGTLFVILGVLLRADALTIVGALLLGIAVLADVYGPVGSPGVGWRQHAAVLTGLVLVLVGIRVRNRRSRRRVLGSG